MTKLETGCHFTSSTSMKINLDFVHRCIAEISIYPFLSFKKARRNSWAKEPSTATYSDESRTPHQSDSCHLQIFCSVSCMVRCTGIYWQKAHLAWICCFATQSQIYEHKHRSGQATFSLVSVKLIGTKYIHKPHPPYAYSSKAQVKRCYRNPLHV